MLSMPLKLVQNSQQQSMALIVFGYSAAAVTGNLWEGGGGGGGDYFNSTGSEITGENLKSPGGNSNLRQPPGRRGAAAKRPRR
jgi:hypothetical protein